MNETASAPPRPPAPMAFLLLRAVHELEAELETALGRVGLSLAKYGVLSKLVDAGEPVALGCLAERCSCVRSNMTQLVDRLEAEQLVERVSDPSDRRSVRAALTAEGRVRHAEGARTLKEAEGELFAGLGEAERATLAELIRRIRREG
ncbi:MAG TPA: MarR family transcriptional regulator [Thermoanaerobaculia bacterium]|nr:MarR family transcriptional regulator [Thermoanaerobaculia bacterium]